VSIAKSDKIVVTGGAGFLGGVVVERMKNAGYTNLFVPRRKEYDLTHEADVERLYADAKPDVVLHMAAEVGGIGANRDNPGRYFFANMAMGLHLIEGARKRGLKKFVQIGTICAYPKFTPVPFKEDDLWNGYPEETNAPYGVAKKGAARHVPGLSPAVWPERRLRLAREPLRPARQLRPAHEPRDPRTHPQVRRSQASPRHGNSSHGAPVRPAASFCTSMTAPKASSRRSRSTTDRNRSIWAADERSRSRALTELVAKLARFEGQITWDTSKPDGQPRRCLDVTRAERVLGFRARTTLEDGLAKTIEWYERANLA
jgi:GDP-L-fucose synthase